MEALFQQSFQRFPNLGLLDYIAYLLSKSTLETL